VGYEFRDPSKLPAGERMDQVELHGVPRAVLLMSGPKVKTSRRARMQGRVWRTASSHISRSTRQIDGRRTQRSGL
jgi:hypothetical protein